MHVTGMPVMLTLAAMCGAGVARRAEAQRPPKATAPDVAPTPIEISNNIPAKCPVPRSNLLTGFRLTGRGKSYGNQADTLYWSWASDGRLYSAYMDGYIEGIGVCGGTQLAGLAYAEGGDPMRLGFSSLGALKPKAPPEDELRKRFTWGYACGSLMHNGVWYVGTYTGTGFGGFHVGMDLNVPISEDERKLVAQKRETHARERNKNRWQGGPHTGKWVTSPFVTRAMFNEDRGKAPVKIGSPHFVDFGRQMEHSPDGKAYLVCMGSSEPLEDRQVRGRRAGWSWSQCDEAYLIRVRPSPETINDESAYEFYAGRDTQGQPVWSKEFGKIKPVLSWTGYLGVITVTYFPPLKRYIMVSSRQFSRYPLSMDRKDWHPDRMALR